jgi:diguanylate cyclase (GGDEF)-like protein
LSANRKGLKGRRDLDCFTRFSLGVFYLNAGGKVLQQAVFSILQGYPQSGFCLICLVGQDSSVECVGLKQGEPFQDLDVSRSAVEDLALHFNEEIFCSRPDESQTSSLPLIHAGLDYQAFAAVPLKKNGETACGCLFLGYPDQHFFTGDERAILRLYASHVSAATELIHLAEENRRREMDMGILVDTAHLLISTLEMDDLLQQICVRMAWVMGVDSYAISTFHRDPDRLRLVGQFTSLGERIDYDLAKDYLLDDYPLTRRVLETDEPALVRLSDPHADRAETGLLIEMGQQIVLMLPMMSGGQPVGLIELYSSNPDYQITSSEFNRLRALSEQVALAITNARLFQKEHEHRAMAEALGKISLALLSSGLDSNAVLEILLEQICQVVPYDTACVMIVEDDEVRVAGERGFDRYGIENLKDFRLVIDENPNLKLISETLRTHYIPDVKADPGWLMFKPSSHAGSWIGAPLVGRNRLLGFLSLDKEQCGFYNEDHSNNLSILAAHASLALLNAYAYREVELASITDFITQSYNHRYFQQQLRKALAAAQSWNQPISLLMLDLDHFKRVNDAFGHQYGDKVLETVASMLKSELRASDVLSRYGGEEFAIILPHSYLPGAVMVAERLRQVIAAAPLRIGEFDVSITISVGVAAALVGSVEAQDLISAADQALYLAKNSGRNRVCTQDGLGHQGFHKV